MNAEAPNTRVPRLDGADKPAALPLALRLKPAGLAAKSLCNPPVDKPSATDLAGTRFGSRSSVANADAPSNDQQNPLWLIVAAMAIFFTAAAAILAAR